MIFGLDTTVRISADHLPGLRPPKIAPKKPSHLSRKEIVKGPDLDRMYREYKKNKSSKSENVNNQEDQ